MIPTPPIVVIIFVVAYAIAGMTIGALSGWVTSLVTKRGSRGVLKDALIGSAGYFVGYFVCAFVPWPRNTVVEHLSEGGTVETTMNRYQHPERVAIVMALLLPILHQLYLLKRARREASTSPRSEG